MPIFDRTFSTPVSRAARKPVLGVGADGVGGVVGVGLGGDGLQREARAHRVGAVARAARRPRACRGRRRRRTTRLRQRAAGGRSIEALVHRAQRQQASGPGACRGVGSASARITIAGARRRRARSARSAQVADRGRRPSGPSATAKRRRCGHRGERA